MKKLGMVDLGFLAAERREMPMHVGGISLYRLPEGADEQEFLHGLANTLRSANELLPPFGDRLQVGRLGLAGPVYWEPDPALDLDYHIRHSALPQPGRYRELFTLVSRLHGTLLDRNRPLWEMHLIEGLQNRQFATYIKTHHAAVDGVRSMHIARSMLESDPDRIQDDSPLSLQSWQRYRDNLKLGKRTEYSDREVHNVADRLKASLDSSASIVQGLRKLTRAWTGRGGDLRLPHLHVPRSSINTSIAGARRFVAQSWPFARIRAVASAIDGTFNDAVLAMCAGALRQYLLIHAELPRESLKAMVPVSIRQEGDVDSSNAIAAISADLATNVADPAQRVEIIQASVRAGRGFFRGMGNNEIQLLSLAMQSPSLVLMPLGLASYAPPYNTVISNVPGMQETMYWNGARLDGSYPASIVTDGIALNITLLTYDKNVDFGIIACRRSLPQVQRIIDYMEDSLVELETMCGLVSDSAGKTTSTRNSGSERKSTQKKIPSKNRRVTKGKHSTSKAAKPKSRGKSEARQVNKQTKAKAKTKTKAKKKTKKKTAPNTPLRAKRRPAAASRPKHTNR